MAQIRTKQDAKDFIKYANGFVFHDSRCEGLTRVTERKDGWEEESWGQGWSDQAPQKIDDIEQYLFDNRKDINAKVKLDAQKGI